MEKLDNKKIIPIVIAVATLLILVGSATYAYFLVGTSYEDYSTNINAETEDVGSVALEAGTNLNMNLTTAHMMLQNSDVTYYATEDGTPQTTVNNVALATAKVTGNGTFTCEYTLNVAYTGTMKEGLPGEGSAILNVNGTDYDLFSTTFPKTISGTLAGLTSSKPKTITGSLRVVNLSGIDQNDMAGTNMGLTFTATEFDCTATVGFPVESDNLSTELLGGLYRYQGSKDEVDDNYICFGTSNATTCKENEDTYMYRIIGMTPEGELKVIKKTNLGTGQWGDNSTEAQWPNSSLFSMLESLVDVAYSSEWVAKVKDRDWKYGQMTFEDFNLSDINIESDNGLVQFFSSLTGDIIYNIEGNFTTTVESKVGLMYAHDFYYQRESNTCVIDEGTETSSECINGWLNMLNNDSTPSQELAPEWTMTYYGIGTGIYYSWMAYSGYGIIHPENSVASCGYRPVFYLKSGLTITGEGTLDSPYMIS